MFNANPPSMIRRKSTRRSSVQYLVSAEDHVENEVRHERLLTDTSRLSSSWANLSVSGDLSGDCSSSSASTNNSPVHRPHSFSGPLVISVTCSSACSPVAQSGRFVTTSPIPSNNPSPYASPISSRIQCNSPGLVPIIGSNPIRRIHTGCASPLLLSNTLSRKRGFLSMTQTGCGSGDDVSREGSPDPSVYPRSNKSLRLRDTRACLSPDLTSFRWPPGPSISNTPPSPSCHLSSPLNTYNSRSPSTSSLPSPHLSYTATCSLSPASSTCIVPVTSTAECPLNTDEKLLSKLTQIEHKSSTNASEKSAN